MAIANIRIDQPLNPVTPVGQPGRARNDLLLGDPVILRNGDDTGVQRWIWSMLNRPLGSTAVLSSVTSPQTTFVPDVVGSYLIQLTVNDGLDGEIQQRVAAVLDSVGFRYPATGETASSVNWPVDGTPNREGWGKDVEKILRGMRRPQLLDATLSEPISVAASASIGFGGIGLPTSLAEIVDYGFVELMPPAGPAPTIVSWLFAPVPGTNGKSLDLVVVEFDTTACSIGDKWALVIGVADVGNVLAMRLEIS